MTAAYHLWLDRNKLVFTRQSTLSLGLLQQRLDLFTGILPCFHSNIGMCNSIWAELWGLKHGIKLARSMNIRNVIFEMDSLAVVQINSVAKAYDQRELSNMLCVEHIMESNHYSCSQGSK